MNNNMLVSGLSALRSKVGNDSHVSSTSCATRSAVDRQATTATSTASALQSRPTRHRGRWCCRCSAYRANPAQFAGWHYRWREKNTYPADASSGEPAPSGGYPAASGAATGSIQS